MHYICSHFSTGIVAGRGIGLKSSGGGGGGGGGGVMLEDSFLILILHHRVFEYQQNFTNIFHRYRCCNYLHHMHRLTTAET